MEIGTINNVRSLTSVPTWSTPKSLYKSNLRKNVFGLKPGGLLSLFTSTSNRETQSHKKNMTSLGLFWPHLGLKLRKKKDPPNKRPPQYDVSAHLSMLVQLL